jgi:predicted phage-related endonuclease
MKILELDQNTPEWLEARKGKITGSKAYDIMPKYRGAGYKSGFYKLIAERLATDEVVTDFRERGHSLEAEAAEAFEKETGKKLTKVGMIVSDFDEDIALSPDNMVEPVDGVYTEAVEIKCLSSDLHIEAVMENAIPGKAADRYLHQILHYFVVVPTLERVWLAFYDPRLSVHSLFVLEFERDAYEEEIEALQTHEVETMERVRKALAKLAY